MTEEKLVSTDFVGSPPNEWGYASRLADLLQSMHAAEGGGA
ncbi:MAG: hypothetical protein ACLF0P_09275 [Thermoanaerobaculia bacterium]